MYKVLVLVFGILLSGLTAIGQATTATTDNKAKKCVTIEECAAKMGMTLEECKTKCQKIYAANIASTGTEVNTETSAVSAASTTTLGSDSDLKTCAAKNGMTLQECKAKCAGLKEGVKVGDQKTKVAAASAKAELANKASEKSSCKKGDKKCCKK